MLAIYGQQQSNAIVNSSHEWGQLRKIKYGGNTLIKYCSPSMTSLMAKALLCVHLFSEHIAVMVGEDVYPNDSIVTLLHRHFQAKTKFDIYANCIQKFDMGAPEAWVTFYQYLHHIEHDLEMENDGIEQIDPDSEGSQCY